MEAYTQLCTADCVGYCKEHLLTSSIKHLSISLLNHLKLSMAKRWSNNNLIANYCRCHYNSVTNRYIANVLCLIQWQLNHVWKLAIENSYAKMSLMISRAKKDKESIHSYCYSYIHSYTHMYTYIRTCIHTAHNYIHTSMQKPIYSLHLWFWPFNGS